MTENQTARDRVRLPWKKSIGILVALAMAPSWVGLAGGWYWFFDLFANFRWQYLMVSVVAVAWAAWARQRRVLVLAALTLLLNALLIGRLAWQPAVSASALAEDFALHVVSLNVHTSNPDKQAVLDYLLASDADVVFLMEVDQSWITALAPLQASYPHQLHQPRDDNFGVALLSRKPWEHAEVIDLGDSGRPSVEMHFTHRGRELVLFGTHPVPPMGREWARLRDGQLTALAARVAQTAAPVLVVGDFNATPWSVGWRRATSGNLDSRSLAAPWRPTWEADSIFAVPIDHALCTAPLVITRRSVGPDVGSDHRPLEISVGMESAP
jgi:endonuclease/exonuclease/phosphatase (EEP) superfamily protein YafD